MALSLAKMYQVTPAKIRDYAKQGQVQTRRKGQPKHYASLGDVYEVVYKVKCTKEWRNVTLRFLKAKKTDPEPKPGLATPVWVRCTCPWFLYNCEYALARYGSATIHYSNGNPANQTNPKNIPYVCKHIYALRSTISKAQPEPIKEPKRKVIPDSTLERIRQTPEMQKQREEIEDEAGLTTQQRREKNKTLEDIQTTIDQSKKQKNTQRTVDNLKTVKKLIEFDNSPIADKARREVDQVLKSVQDNPNDEAIIRKLNQLIKKFRGF